MVVQILLSTISHKWRCSHTGMYYTTSVGVSIHPSDSSSCLFRVFFVFIVSFRTDWIIFKIGLPYHFDNSRLLTPDGISPGL